LAVVAGLSAWFLEIVGATPSTPQEIFQTPPHLRDSGKFEQVIFIGSAFI
jgi:hypothetical protein